ncbi:MAG: ferritin-like domain-containing protein [Gemmatimonadota bacterium]|nr:ferritin-like domain-containing protein [Gemmatimonadota bacterium]
MEKQTQSNDWAGTLLGPSTRRQFLRRAAGGAAIIATPSVLASCHVLGAAGKPKLDFGDDFGVLNYAYALETLEAKFYQTIIMSPPRDLKPGEFEILRDIGAHEVQHRRFFKRALGVLRIKVPEVDFSSIDFTRRDSVLAQAKIFEDTGVAGYNGAGNRLKLAEFLTIAGKIVSVEARHAATIRDMIDPGSRAFAGDDVVDETGRDRALAPLEVLAMAQPFFKSRLVIAGL